MNKIRKEILSPEVVKMIDQREEFRHQQKEEVKAEIRQGESFVAPDGSADICNPEVQRGRPLQAQQIIRRLKKMNPALHFEVAVNFPDIYGIYIVENRPDPITNQSPWKRHICGMPNGLVSEFHQPLVIEEEVPDPDNPTGQLKKISLEGHVPGWRAVLLRLVTDGQITLSDCERYFYVSQGRSSQRWKQAVN